MDSSRMFSFSTVLDRWRLTRVSMYESRALIRVEGVEERDWSTFRFTGFWDEGATAYFERSREEAGG